MVSDILLVRRLPLASPARKHRPGNPKPWQLNADRRGTGRLRRCGYSEGAGPEPPRRGARAAPRQARGRYIPPAGSWYGRADSSRPGNQAQDRTTRPRRADRNGAAPGRGPAAKFQISAPRRADRQQAGRNRAETAGGRHAERLRNAVVMAVIGQQGLPGRPVAAFRRRRRRRGLGSAAGGGRCGGWPGRSGHAP